MLLFLVIFCVIVALGFGVASGWSDFTGLKISNIYPAAIMAAFVPAFLAVYFMAPESGYFASIQSHMISFGAMFAITFVLFSMKAIGAGDSKLSTALALWVGMPGFSAYLFYMALMGGVLGLAALALKKWKPVDAPAAGGWVERAQGGVSAVPCGIAIAFGALVAFYYVGYFDPEKLVALGR